MQEVSCGEHFAMSYVRQVAHRLNILFSFHAEELVRYFVDREIAPILMKLADEGWERGKKYTTEEIQRRGQELAEELTASHECPKPVQRRVYLDKDNNLFCLSRAANGKYRTYNFYKMVDVRSKQMPPVGTWAEAQVNLDNWAEKQGLKEIGA